MSPPKRPRDESRLDEVVAAARRAREERERGYRSRALAMYPWVCGRCGREFDRRNVHELTVHHRDHDHDNNPEDGSNWELLCLYCHDMEHAHAVDVDNGKPGGQRESGATYKPFAQLDALLKKKK